MLLALVSSALAAQTFPFPQNATYPFGIRPAAHNHADALAAYNDWKSRYVVTDQSGYRRVFYDENPAELGWTVSEGIGYGMLLAVNMAERPLFDDLWSYTKLHLDSNGLMKWRVRADGTNDGQNSASDADEDMAFALLCADKQWGSGGAINYLQEAVTLINDIYENEVDPVTFALKPGDGWGSSPPVNPSYLIPAYYRVFRNAAQDDRWLNVIQKSYDILQAAANPSTGLLPDWCLPDGSPDPSRSYEYSYDATRTPWRIALDYLWFGTADAAIRTNALTAFANGQGIGAIKDGYQLDGTLVGNNHNNAFVGPFAAGAMAAPAFQSFCDAAYQDNVSVHGDNYFNTSLKALTLFLLTGNFLNPCPTCGSSPPPLPPSSPSWLRTVTASQSQINLQWDDNANNESGFKIEQKQGCCGPWTLIATVGANVTTFQSTGLTCGTTYAYRVWAYNSAGDSGKTNEAGATTSACTPPPVPACPTWLRFTAPTTSSQLNLLWTDNSNNESGFKIERKQGCCGPWTLVATVGANATTYPSSGLTCNTTYAYRVWAYNSAGDSCKTNEAGSTTSSCP
jgi:endo-1,4-beta-D-glucanase Y